MKSSRLLLPIALVLCTLFGLSAQNQDDKPYMTKSFSAQGLTQANLSTSGGNISVFGGQSGDARIEIYIRSGNWKQQLSEADIQERLKAYEITIDKSTNTLTATVKRIAKDWDWKSGLAISFRLYVPSLVACTMQTSGGNISFSDMEGNQTAKTSGGNISLASVKGIVTAKTSGGNIAVHTFTGTLQVQTSGGNIDMKNSAGDLKMETSGGNITMNQVTGSLDAHTSGGNVSASIHTLEKYLKLSTSGGNIQVKMPLDKGMDLDISGDKVAIAMQNFNGTVKNDLVRGKLNGGGIPVRISTSGGSVRVN